MVASPATKPSAGVLAIRSSSERRLRCAAMASAPYSTKLPGSTRSAMFSRAVRRPVVPLGDSGLPALVQGDQMTVPDLIEVGDGPVEIDARTRLSAPTLSPVRANTTNGSPVPTT